MNRKKKSKKEVLAIIPARGGSKGIPKKNITSVCGRPLIAYTIDVALRSSSITRVVVSTEDTEIAQVAEEFGAEVPFLRPHNLAEDNSSTGDVINYTLSMLRAEGYCPDIFIQLYPTNLFRNPRLINFLTRKLIDGCYIVKTVKPIDLDWFNFFSPSDSGKLRPLQPKYSSDLSGTQRYYRHYGLFYGLNLGHKTSEYYLYPLADPILMIDVDSYTDLITAEIVIKRKLFDFHLE